jgi:ATP/maltotriose-dependent transcriptional regulator MalT
VVIAGRYDPHGSMIDLEGTGMVTTLRTADLALDEAEVHQLACRYGLNLPASSIRMLLERTEGWAIGLALAMPLLRDADEPQRSIERFNGDHRAVADYLVTEVIERLDEEERDVLVDSAVRGVVPLPLSVKLSGRVDAGEVLHRLSLRNALIDEEGDGYRYHPVLLSFIQAEGRRKDEPKAARNHQTAARWFAAEGDGVAAVEQALASNDSPTIGAALDQFGLELVLTGHAHAALQAHWRLPRDDDPLSTIVLQLLMEAPYFTDTRRAQHLFSMASRNAHPRSGHPTSWELALLALRCFIPASPETDASRLAELRSPASVRERSVRLALDLLAAMAEAWCLSRLNGSAEAGELFQEVAVSAHRAGYDWLYMIATESAATVATVAGEWSQVAVLEDRMVESAKASAASLKDQASAAATIVIAARRYQHCRPLPVDSLERIALIDPLGLDLGLLIPARMLLTLPELDSDPSPRRAVESTERIMQEHGARFPRLLAAASLRLVSMRLALDGRRQARDTADFVADVLGPDSLESMLVRFVLNPPTHLGDSAETALENALHGRVRSWHPGAEVSGWILLARLAQETKRFTEADARITSAVRVADRFRTERPFAARDGEGAWLVEAHLGHFGHLEKAARTIVERSVAVLPERRAEFRIIDALTPREHEILLELPVHQSVGEIARKQRLSVNTVKTHLRNIYQKLDATGRSEAVAVAHEHGLL